VLAELSARAETLRARPLTSVFFGGGTPSLWGARPIARILETIARLFSTGESPPEITVECNPSSFSPQLAAELAMAGVNRLSLGVQSLDAQRLGFLGRLHDVEGGLAAVRAALASGISQVSADLIFGVHGQSAEQAAREVETVAKLGVQHLSAYSLTVEPGTAFGALHRKGRLPLLGEAAAADSFVAVSDTLRGLGFEHYEISNYSLPDCQSEHNLGYWRGRDYLGIGCGAWGTLDDGQHVFRYRNTPVIERYLNQESWPLPSPETAGPGQPYQSYERLTPEMRVLERLMLGLRLREGVDVRSLETTLSHPVLDRRRSAAVSRLVERRRLLFEDPVLRIPESAWLFADDTIAQLA
jgi:oxygen-independent coproporphyrinogen-3 oxidase